MSHSSMIASDPLSDVLTVLGARSASRTRLEAAGDWALCFPEKHKLKLVAVLRGGCWILLPGQEPQALRRGDVFLIGRSSYAVASHPDIEPVDGAPLYAEPGCEVVRGGAETVLLGASIAFAAPEATSVTDAPPGFLRLEMASDAASAVSRTLALLDAELGRGRIGGALVTIRLGTGGLGEISQVSPVRFEEFLPLNHRQPAGYNHHSASERRILRSKPTRDGRDLA